MAAPVTLGGVVLPDGVFNPGYVLVIQRAVLGL